MKKFVRLFVFSLSGIATFTSCQKEVKDVIVPQEEQVTETELKERQIGVSFFKKDLILKDETGLNEVSLVISSQNKASLERYLDTYDLSLKVGKPDAKKIKEPTSNTSFNTKQLDSNLVAESEKVSIEIISHKIQNPSEGFGINVKVKEIVAKALSKGARTQAYTNYSEYTSSDNPTGLFVSIPGDRDPNTGVITNRYIDAAIELRRTRLTSFQRAYFQIRYNSFPGNSYVLAGSEGSINTNPVFEWISLGEYGTAVYNFTGNSYRRAMLKVYYTPISTSDNGFTFQWFY